jgi:very-short-patch-repair endonuclease
VNRLLAYWAKLYSNQTPAEKALEPAIAALGVPYRFQHPVWAFGIFPDYVLLDERVVIEVDDPSHSQKRKKVADEERTRKLNAAGWRVVRCSNAEALANPEAALARMLQSLDPPLRCKKDI